jgi:soluble lytic murein transglycosylase-like protein
MEESSIPWHFKSYGIHNPYFRMIYLLFIFSVGFLFTVQIASGAETLKAPSAKIEQKSSITTLASSRIAITPVRKSKSDRFNPVIKRAADRYEVDPALIKAVIMAESAYNPKAVSKQGAKGLMQLMPGTARALGVKNAFNPSHNINGGAQIPQATPKCF